MILGIDEVGRGPWAGPLVVGAVVLGDRVPEGLTDSKKLTKKRRELLDAQIREMAAGFGLGWVDAGEIDEIGLGLALRLATRRAVEQVRTSYHEIIIDGTINLLADTPLEKHVTTLKKADLLIPSVSAASIIAKVARDTFMAEQDKLYPGYGFGAHVGYGTAVHRAAIQEHGVTSLHRLSFAPLTQYRQEATMPPRASEIEGRTTKQTGDRAEQVVADFLTARGHGILERNWRTKFCEIDIVSRKDDTVYFTEVKYRKNAEYGDGLEAVTTKKQRQMKFAAEYFALKHKLDGVDLRLAAASVASDPPRLEQWVELS